MTVPELVLWIPGEPRGQHNGTESGRIQGNSDPAARQRPGSWPTTSEGGIDVAKPSANEQWWNNRGPFVRLSADHTHPTEAEWDALDDYPGRKLVYFIESTHSGLIKIGISVNPYQRLVDLGASWMRMLALEAGGFDRAVEYALRAWRGIKPGDYA